MSAAHIRASVYLSPTTMHRRLTELGAPGPPFVCGVVELDPRTDITHAAKGIRVHAFGESAAWGPSVRATVIDDVEVRFSYATLVATSGVVPIEVIDGDAITGP